MDGAGPMQPTPPARPVVKGSTVAMNMKRTRGALLGGLRNGRLEAAVAKMEADQEADEAVVAAAAMAEALAETKEPPPEEEEEGECAILPLLETVSAESDDGTRPAAAASEDFDQGSAAAAAAAAAKKKKKKTNANATNNNAAAGGSLPGSVFQPRTPRANANSRPGRGAVSHGTIGDDPNPVHPAHHMPITCHCLFRSGLIAGLCTQASGHGRQFGGEQPRPTPPARPVVKGSTVTMNMKRTRGALLGGLRNGRLEAAVAKMEADQEAGLDNN